MILIVCRLKVKKRKIQIKAKKWRALQFHSKNKSVQAMAPPHLRQWCGSGSVSYVSLWYGWILASKYSFKTLKSAQIGSYSIHFGLSSANWCGSGSGSGSSLSLWCGSGSYLSFWCGSGSATLSQHWFADRSKSISQCVFLTLPSVFCPKKRTKLRRSGK